MARGIHYIYTFEARLIGGQRVIRRITSASDRQALCKLANVLKEIEINNGEPIQLKSVLLLEKFPKSKHNRQKALNRKRGQVERRKREALDKLAAYDGTQSNE